MSTILHVLLVPARVSYECPYCLRTMTSYIKQPDIPHEFKCRCGKTTKEFEIKKEMIKQR